MSAAAIADQVDAVVAFVGARRAVSFVELLEFLAERGTDVAGQLALCMPGDPNLILWAGVSQDVADLVAALQRDGRVVPRSTSWLVYLIDGRALRYPIAHRPPRGGYRSEHWLPVVFEPRSQRSTNGSRR